MEECIPKSILEAIKAREAVVFCGAGISKNSGLPLAEKIVEYILDKLSVSEKEIIMRAELPFEAFIEILHESSNISRILDIFDAGKPNTNHILLAKLAKAGYIKTICTTNFDNLIENALKDEKLIVGKHYQVFYKDEEFDSIDWNNDKLRLIKLHGSIENKDEMAITLQQVATKIVSRQRQNIINYVFSTGQHKDVLILGYSCSDVFDISPLIVSISKNHKRVLLIDHHPTPENKDKRVGQIEDIRTKVKKNPFRNFKESKRIFHDTDSSVAEIWRDCLYNEYLFVEPTEDSLAWKKCVDDWYLEATENYSSAIKYSIAGQIFLQISQFENAKKYFQQSLSIQKEMGNKLENKRREGACLGHLGLVHDELGNYLGAIAYHEQALRIARETGDVKTEGNHLGNLGLTYFNLGEYRKAKKYCEKALLIARKMGDRRVEGNRLNTLGSIYRNLRKYRKAVKNYEEALKIAQDIGDKEGEESRLHNLGIVYANRGKHHEAINNFKTSLQISKEIGNKKAQGESLGCLGTAYGELGELQKAKKYLRQALAVDCKIGNKKGAAHDLSNLGNVHDELGEFKKALEYYKKGIMIAKEIGNKNIEGAILRNLTLTHLRIGVYCKFYRDFEPAAKLVDEGVETSTKKKISAGYYEV